jgi:hypothetical protein
MGVMIHDHLAQIRALDQPSTAVRLDGHCQKQHHAILAHELAPTSTARIINFLLD